MKSALFIVAAVLLLQSPFSCLGQNQSANGATPQAVNAPVSGSTNLRRLEAGDLVEVTVFDAPELSSKYRLSPAGDI